MWSKHLGCAGLAAYKPCHQTFMTFFVFTSLSLMVLICEMDSWRAALIGPWQELDEVPHTMTSTLMGQGQTSQERRKRDKPVRKQQKNNSGRMSNSLSLPSHGAILLCTHHDSAPGTVLFLNPAQAASSPSSRPCTSPSLSCHCQGVSPTSPRASKRQVITVIIPTWAQGAEL